MGPSEGLEVEEGRLRAHLSGRFGGPGEDEVLQRLSREDLAGARAVVSWRGAVIGDGVCSVALARSYLDLVQEESCGRCSPCRIGTEIMSRILRRLEEGTGTEADIAELRRLAEQVDDAAWCGVADTVRDPILALLDAGADHFAAHAAGTTCLAVETHGWVGAPCRSTCPSNVNCPSYIFQVQEEHAHLATGLVKQDNPLPAVIGRTCHRPCEGNCTLADIRQPIAINFLKRWAADRAEGIVQPPGAPGEGAGSKATAEGRAPQGPAAIQGPVATQEKRPHETAEEGQEPGGRWYFAPRRSDGEPVAIIGAGPAGLSAGFYLARRGHRPVIFEALDVPGGMLYVGIPEYRLPKKVLRREVELIEREGVEIRYGHKVGTDILPADLEEMGFRATFIAVGAHKGKRMGIPGEDLPGCLDAIAFLRSVALGEAVDVGPRVMVVGGGNSAMDAARTCVRLGAEEVKVVYRRAEEQMPANPWEVEEAREEGVDFRLLASPLRCEGDSCVRELVCQKMELGPPDDSGRRRPVPTEEEPFSLDADTIIAAIGQQPDFGSYQEVPEIEFNKWGYPVIDTHTFMTTKPGVFVGGDAVTGGASVIEAIAAGKTVAKYADMYLRGDAVAEDMEDRTKRIAAYLGAQDSRYPIVPGTDYGCRAQMPVLAPGERRTNFAQTELGYSDAQARREAARCLRCHRPIIVAG